MTDDRPCIVTPCGGAAPRGAPVRAKPARHAVPPSACGRAGGAAAAQPCSLGFQPNFPILRGRYLPGGRPPEPPARPCRRAPCPPTAFFPPPLSLRSRCTPRRRPSSRRYYVLCSSRRSRPRVLRHPGCPSLDCAEPQVTTHQLKPGLQRLRPLDSREHQGQTPSRVAGRPAPLVPWPRAPAGHPAPLVLDPGPRWPPGPGPRWHLGPGPRWPLGPRSRALASWIDSHSAAQPRRPHLSRPSQTQTRRLRICPQKNRGECANRLNTRARGTLMRWTAKGRRGGCGGWLRRNC